MHFCQLPTSNIAKSGEVNLFSFPSISPNPRHRLIIRKQHRSRAPIPILRNQQFPSPLGRVSLPILHHPVKLWPMDQQHHIRILLNGARIPQIGQFRPFPRSGFKPTVQLTQQQHRHLQVFRQPLGITRSLRYHILPVVIPMLRLHFGQLQIVNNDQITKPALMHPLGRRLDLAHTPLRSVINVKRLLRKRTAGTINGFQIIDVAASICFNKNTKVFYSKQQGVLHKTARCFLGLSFKF